MTPTRPAPFHVELLLHERFLLGSAFTVVDMLRAANTGISGVIDAYGRVETRSNLIVEAVIDSVVPPALSPTPFARFGLLAVLPLIVLALIPILFRVRKPSIS